MDINLKEFLSKYGNSLKKKVLEGFNPFFNPDKKDAWDRDSELKLESLKRKPFPAQSNTVLALAKGFFVKNMKGLILVGEMGAGKTICSIALAHLIPRHNYRVLVMCPGHLVRKWIREIETTMPKCKVINLNGKGLAELEELKNGKKTSCPEFYVIGKERAKNHYQVKKAVTHQKHLERFLCPRCGKYIDIKVFKPKRPKCPVCKEPFYQADNNGFRRFAKAEYIKKYLKGKFDLFVADEIHELKGGTTAQGQALADLACSAKKTLGLTGTLMGGYSTNLFYILWRLMPREIKEKGIVFNSPMGFAELYGTIERTLIQKKTNEYNSASIGGNSGTRTLVKEKPGVSPLVLTDFLLGHTVFMRLADISTALPPFDEKVIEVNMTAEQQDAYKDFESNLYDAVRKSLARGDCSLLGALINSLLAYPDGARRGELVIHPHTRELVVKGPPIDEHILPKERELLNVIEQELSEGRKCLVCLEHTGTRDLIPDLRERIEERGFAPLILRSNTVSVEKREEWVKNKIGSGEYNIMITNPNLIKTGLDLIEFPTIIFFQTGYSVFTLRQASRRSWRIGQNASVRVYYMSYADSMQSTALSLIATKLETAMAIEGDLSDKGLAALAEGSNSMLYEMARSLLKEKEVSSLSNAWKRYKQKEINSDSFIGDDVTEIETTTTTIEKGRRNSTISCKKVIRGKIYPRKGYALAYIDAFKFVLKNGKILFNNSICGNYDKKGLGIINNKPIQIAREAANRFVLLELKQQ